VPALPCNEPAELSVFQIPEVQERPAFSDRPNNLTLRHHKAIAARTLAAAQKRLQVVELDGLSPNFSVDGASLGEVDRDS
jgi:hypothetical protein